MPINKIELIKEHDLHLYVDTIENEEGKVKIMAAAIARGNVFLIRKASRLMQLKNELYLFDRGDENNRMLTIERKPLKDESKKYVTVLVLNEEDGGPIEVGRSDAKTIYDWLNIMVFFKQQQFHLTFATQERSQDEWAKALQNAEVLN